MRRSNGHQYDKMYISRVKIHAIGKEIKIEYELQLLAKN